MFLTMQKYINHDCTRLVVGMVLALALLFTANDVRAQGAVGLSIQPAIVEDRVDPGQVIEGAIRITNNEPTERVFFVVKRNISSLSDSGQPKFAEEGEVTGYELSEWVDIASEVTAPAGQQISVPYRIQVPLDASPGGHFGGIFFSAEPPRLRSVGAGIGYQVGTIINMRISGDVREEAVIREFTTEQLLYGSAQVSFKTTVENRGNVLIRPRGDITVTDMFGREAGKIRINNDGGAVLPEGTRNFENSWDEEGFYFGRYEALVGLVYGEDGRKTITATYSFWILPLKILLPAVIGLIVVVLLIYFITRLYVRRKVKQMYNLSPQTAKLSRRQQVVLPPQQTAFPKLAVVAIALLVFTLLFLGVLFLFLA